MVARSLEGLAAKAANRIADSTGGPKVTKAEWSLSSSSMAANLTDPQRTAAPAPAPTSAHAATSKATISETLGGYSR